MKRITLPALTATTAIAVAINAAFTGLAHGQTAEAPAPEVKINKVDVQFVSVPQYQTNLNFRPSRDAVPWLQIEVEFDLKIQGATGASPKFLDELIVSYYVAFPPQSLDGGAENPLAGKALTLDVTHVDVKSSTPGQMRYSVAYMPGRLIERMTLGKNLQPANINVAVEIKQKGASAALASKAEGPIKGTDGWWNQVPHFPGVLLQKDQTPFAPLAWDRHEPVKPASGR